MPDRDLTDRTYVVTGANTGIGKETVRVLAGRGARVVLASRSPDKTRPVIEELKQATGNDRLDYVELDLGDLASVRRAAADLLARDLPIHGLINNAGLAGPRGTTKQGFELAFGTNHLGHFLWTKLVLDRVRASGPARIVNVASASHYQARRIDWDALRKPTASLTGLPEYAVSKVANVLFTRELAKRLPASEVTAYALHPGAIASDIWQRRIPRPIVAIMKLFMKSVADGAKTTIYCATSPACAKETGLYYTDSKEKRPSRLAQDDAVAAELWKRSEEWTQA
ncbi:MAG TPA: SDR family oxidoreductase [Kofleriaceae bacterium]|nr:SDR family oxidoreductase [Kofleriaceae bacterium]